MRLVVAANRDEHYTRPTATANYWHDHPDVLGGRDLEKGGTWIAATRDGRWAAVTNYRDPTAAPSGRSRGDLVATYVNQANDPATYADKVDAESASYPPFNLLLGDSSELVYVTNRGKPATRTLGAGIYGLSNHLLDTPWPKVSQARQRMSMLLQSRDETAVLDGMFELLADRQCAPDHALPATGVSLEWERVLSAPFIVAPGYGTRASTVLIVRSDGSALFEERSFSEGGVPTDSRRFDFEVRAAQAEQY
ncbi:MAG: NRDE family protein [Burkholderiales bacterium]